MVAKPAPASAHVVKAFNTLFRDVLAASGHGVGNYDFSLGVNVG